ncbi:vanadium-dependent haloperoxidase [Segetibacter aerophilus]|nr:vanadium-dependent haloperoxidase [Segetibacter aerophilus]
MQLSLTKTRYRLHLLIVFFILCFASSCDKDDLPPSPADESGDVAYQWYKLIARIQLLANPQPVLILNHRNFGYIGVGLYESVRPGITGSVSLASKLYQMPPMPQPELNKEYSWSSSANAALASMFKQFLLGLTDANKASIDSLENANNTRFRLSINDEVLTRSQAFGRSIANSIFNWSTSDNFSLSSQGYTLPVFPGSWVPTPPAFAVPVGPYLKDSRPFLSYSLTATAPPLPFSYSEDPNSNFYKEAKEVYDIGKTLTAEQKAIANWWADAGGAGVGVPAPYHLLSIVSGVLEERKVNLQQAASVYAKIGIGQKDGPINTFRAKYQYNLVRPVTYIQKNIDPVWQSYLPTPPYPEYPSGLVGLYAPLIQVMVREFGDIAVTDHSYDWAGIPSRQYTSFTKLIEEAAVSRIYAGIHYRSTQNASLEIGKALGNQIADIKLTAP